MQIGSGIQAGISEPFFTESKDRRARLSSSANASKPGTLDEVEVVTEPCLAGPSAETLLFVFSVLPRQCPDIVGHRVLTDKLKQMRDQRWDAILKGWLLLRK